MVLRQQNVQFRPNHACRAKAQVDDSRLSIIRHYLRVFNAFVLKISHFLCIIESSSVVRKLAGTRSITFHTPETQQGQEVPCTYQAQVSR